MVHLCCYTFDLPCVRFLTLPCTWCFSSHGLIADALHTLLGLLQRCTHVAFVIENGTAQFGSITYCHTGAACPHQFLKLLQCS